MRKAAAFCIFNLMVLAWFIGCLSSCKTTKEVIKTETKYDSTAIHEAQRLANVLKETNERHLKEKENWESTGVVFDTPQCPDSATTTVTKIVFDNGKLKSIEGNVKALNQSLYEKSTDLLDAYSTIDSLAFENEKKEMQLSKKATVVVKEVKTKVGTAWWVYALFVLGGIGIESRLKLFEHLKRIFSLIKF